MNLPCKKWMSCLCLLALITMIAPIHDLARTLHHSHRKIVRPAHHPVDTYAMKRIYQIVRDQYHRPLGEAREIASSIIEISRESHLDPALVTSICAIESGFNPLQTSPMNARGLMGVIATFPNGRDVWLQTLRNTGIIERESELYHIKIGIRAGCYIFNHYLNANDGDVHDALSNYLGGTRYHDRYVQRVRAFYLRYNLGSPTDFDTPRVPSVLLLTSNLTER